MDRKKEGEKEVGMRNGVREGGIEAERHEKQEDN